MIDHIGGKHISLRRRNGGLVITCLDPGDRMARSELEMEPEEWLELCELIAAIDAAMRFSTENGPPFAPAHLGRLS